MNEGQSLTSQRTGNRSRKAALAAGLVFGLALVGTLILYGGALKLPFFFDDMVHMRWLDWHTLPEVWTTAEGLGYYRPMTMSVWKVEELVLGEHGTLRLHLLSLILHALNASLAGLVGWRAFRGPGRYAFALLTSLLFLTFPFSYQAVPSTSSLSKPLIATLSLGSVLLYWEGRRHGAKWLILLSLILALLAPFAYETGIMVPLAILSVEVYAYLEGDFRRPSRLPLLYMLLVWGVTLPVILLAEPETGASLGLPALRSLWQNGIYFLEGLLFPISFVTTPLARTVAIDQYVLLTAVVLLGFAALSLFYHWAGQIKLFLYALSWFVVGVLPLWFALEFAYVITSPRLLYLGAVGIALLWAGVPVLLWIRVPGRWWQKALAVAIAVTILAFGATYVRHKMALASTVAAPLWAAVEAAEAEEGQASLLYLNVPAWIAPKEPVYRVGTEGLTFIPEYVQVQDFVYVNSGVEPDIRAVMFDPLKQEWPAYIGYAGEALDWDSLAQAIQEANGVYLTTYSPAGLGFAKAGSVANRDSQTVDPSPLAHFGDGISLSEVQSKLSDGELVIDLWWSSQAPMDGVTVLVHVYDGTGQLVAQGDGYPLAGLYPPRYWQPGDLVQDVRRIALPEDLPDGVYNVVVGWYDAATGQRLPARDEKGQPVADDAVQLFQFRQP